jgi:hypothetical protein
MENVGRILRRPFGISDVNLIFLGSFGILYRYLVCFVVIWYVLESFGIFYLHLVYLIFIWYILFHLVDFISFGIFYCH